MEMPQKSHAQMTGLPGKSFQYPTPHPAGRVAEDPEVARVLDMLERDILFNPELLKPIDQSLVNLMAELYEGVEFDPDAQLFPDDGNL